MNVQPEELLESYQAFMRRFAEAGYEFVPWSPGEFLRRAARLSDEQRRKMKIVMQTPILSSAEDALDFLSLDPPEDFAERFETYLQHRDDRHTR